ncbi:MAG: hypothetical protein ACLU9T_07060 [Blautia faecis]
MVIILILFAVALPGTMDHALCI